MPNTFIVYAWGFNALGQLCLPGLEWHNDDIPEPHSIASATDAQVVWTSWSDTLLFLNGTAIYCGGHTDSDSSHMNLNTLQNKNPSAYLFYGNHDGLKGFFEKRLCRSDGVAFITELVAVAENGHVAVINFCSQECSFGPEGSYMKEFTTLEAFEIWHKNVYSMDAQERQPGVTESSELLDLVGFYVGPSKPMQLEAGTTGFTLLLAPGKVLTWGDARYPQCLGRPVHSEEDAATPWPVPYLSESTVTRIASGGWMSGAVSSEEHGEELYIWGQSEPGFEKQISVLKENESEEQGESYVHVANVQIDGEEAKVVDFGIGAGHLIVAAKVTSETGVPEKRAVFACGAGEFGQLGIGSSVEFIEELTEIPSLRGLRDCKVVCGSKMSFVVAKKPEKC